MKILKNILAVFFCLVILSGAAYFYVTADKAASHSTLKNANLPPLIPVSEFYADTSAYWDHKVSSSGKIIAFFGTEWGTRYVYLRRSNEAKPFTKLSEKNIDYFFWHSAKEAVLFVSDKRLWEVDPENPTQENWQDVTPRGFQSWWISSTPENTEQRIVISSSDRNPAFADLYTVRQDGGGKKLLVKNEGKTLSWLLDENNEPAIRLDRNNADGTNVLIKNENNDGWRPLLTVDVRDQFYFINNQLTDDPLYAISNRGRDKQALVSIDKLTGVEMVIAEHENVDIFRAYSLNEFSSEIDLLKFNDGYPELRPLSERGKAFVKLAEELGAPIDISGIENSPSGRFALVAASVNEQSYEYFLFDLQEMSKTKIADYSFRKHKAALTTSKPVSFKARDGMEIPAFLTLPKGTEGKNLPTIVRIHGGPAARVKWEYNHYNQFLANRGYAILDVNFRGSVGYGKTFTAAGYGNFGRSMQTDIVDAANWIIDEGIADKNAIAVMGASYGGYSSALAMTRDAGLFKAGVVQVAVTDLIYQMENNPFSWQLHEDELRRYFGDITNDDDRAEMNRQSPITHASAATDPILLLHGKRDRTVGFEQSEEFERALKAAGKEVKAHYFEKAGHSYGRWQDRVTHARLVEEFLAENLGGRSGGWDWSELAAEWF